MKDRVLAISLIAVMLGALAASAAMLPGAGSRQEDDLQGPVERVELAVYELGGSTGGAANHEMQRVLVRYDRQGRLLEEEILREGTRAFYRAAQYDEMGRLVRFDSKSDDYHYTKAIGTYSQDAGEIVWESYDISCLRTVMHCDASGKAVCAEASSDGVLLWSQRMDAEGRVVEQIYFRSGKPYLKKSWSYDSAGRLDKALILEEGRPAIETIRSYDEGGRLKQSLMTREDGTVLSDDRHTYGSNGKLMLEDTLNPHYPALGRLLVHYGYDDKGLLVRVIYEDFDAKGFMRSRETQLYANHDAYGNWTSLTSTTQSFHEGLSVAQFGLQANRTISYYAGD